MQIEMQEKIFKRWLDEYSRLIFKVVRAYAVSPQDRDDLFQEILMQLYLAVLGFRGDAKLQWEWLCFYSLPMSD